MVRFGLVIGFALVLSNAALAQAQIDTPSGPAFVVKTPNGSPRLTVGGQVFDFDGYWGADFAARVGDVVLVGLYSGGTACPAEYFWLDTRPGLIRVSDRFGTCSDLPQVSWDSQAVTVTLPSFVAGAGPVAFVWDGKTAAVTEMQLAPPLSGLPPSMGVAGWIGQHPGKLLAAPEWRGQLLGLMGQAGFEDALRIIQVGHDFAANGPWISASGCQPHNCDVTLGAVALGQDGRLVVALWEYGSGLRLWGDPGPEMPNAIAEVMRRAGY